MILLKAKSKKELSKFIGAFLPRWIFDYFTIYTLAKSQSKSELMRSILEEWIVKQRTTISDDALLDEVAVNVRQQWKLECIGDPNAKLVPFKASLVLELRSRGLSDEQIETIFEDFK
jgi:hypothetical protein